MKLPNTAYKARFVGKNEVSLLLRKNSYDTVWVTLPGWLVLLIEERAAKERDNGRQEIRDAINQILRRG